MQTKAEPKKFFSRAELESETFQANKFLDRIFKEHQCSLLKTDNLDDVDRKVKDINSTLSLLAAELQETSTKVKEELETQLFVNEIKMESQANEKTQMEKEFKTLKGLYKAIEIQLSALSQGSQIEQSLREVSQEKDTVSRTKELIEHFRLFNKQNAQIPQLYKAVLVENKVDKIEEAAQNIQILHKVCLNISAAQEFKQSIETINDLFDKFEVKILIKFKEAYWSSDSIGLKRYLKIIDQYDIMNRVAEHYIEQTLGKLKINQEYNISSGDSVKRQVSNHLFLLNSAYKQSLQDQMPEDELIKNAYSILEIFGGYANDVLKTFIAYSFDEIMGKIVRQILGSCKNKKPLYLKYFDWLFQVLSETVASLNTIQSTLSAQASELGHSFFVSLFQEYQETYFESELDHLSGIISDSSTQVLSKLDRSRSQGEKGKTKAEIKKWIQNFVKQQDGSSEKGRLNKKEMEHRLTIMKDILLQESIEIIFVSVNESLKRVENLSFQDKLFQNRAEILDMFLNSFGNLLIQNLIEYTVQTVPNLNRKTLLNADFFEVIPQLNILVSRMDLIFNQYSKFQHETKDMELLMQRKEETISKLEISIQKSIQCALASIFINCNRILNDSQRSKDFNKTDTNSINGPTAAATEFIEFLSIYANAITSSQTTSNKNRVLESLGLQIISILMGHFTKTKVTLQGSVQMQADVSEYENFLLKHFNFFEVKAKFDILNALVSIYKIERFGLESYLNEQVLFRQIEASVVESYLANRADSSNSISIPFFKR